MSTQRHLMEPGGLPWSSHGRRQIRAFLDVQFQHQAEQVALWNVSALLERELVEPFTPDYRRLVDGARDRLASAD